MGKFQSTKLFDGFSCVFRQWKAKNTHCRFMHGYGVSFRVWLEGSLDDRNWVWDFGGMKRAQTKIDGMSPKAGMDYMFDHTILVAKDDPMLSLINELEHNQIAQVRIVEATGAEKFAEFIFNKLDKFVLYETDGRVRVAKVEFMEHGKNTGIYEG